MSNYCNIALVSDYMNTVYSDPMKKQYIGNLGFGPVAIMLTWDEELKQNGTLVNLLNSDMAKLIDGFVPSSAELKLQSGTTV